MEFIPVQINDYAVAHTEVGPPYLYDLYRETHLTVLRPRMLSGSLQGRFLSMVSKMITPDLIVELGTYTGFSALCLAEGLSETGRLITIDNNEELIPIQKKYFELSPYTKQIEPVLTRGLTYMDSLPESIDLVFIDADKENYLNYYQALLPKMRVGGILIVDNVLWSGKVTEVVDGHDAETEALVAFNTFVHNDDRVENILLPLRDGLMMIRKK